MTVPTLILIGELDDWTSAGECRNLVDGRDGWGISRQKDRRVRSSSSSIPAPITHSMRRAHDPLNFGHHLEFNQSATDQSIVALANFSMRRSASKSKAR
jgi:hypothetical protein